MSTGEVVGEESVKEVAVVDDRFLLCRRDGHIVQWDAATLATRPGPSPDPGPPLAGNMAAGLLVFRSGFARASIRNVASGAEVAELSSHGDHVAAAAFSGDGRMLVTVGAHWDRSVRVWDVATLRSYVPRRAHDGQVQELAFQDVATLLSVSGATRLAWSVGSGQLADKPVTAPPPKPDTLAEVTEAIQERDPDRQLQTRNSFAFSWHYAITPDGGLLVSGWVTGAVKLWNTATGGLLAVLRPADRQAAVPGVDVVLALNDGRRAITAAWDGYVRLWDLPAAGSCGRWDRTTRTPGSSW